MQSSVPERSAPIGVPHCTEVVRKSTLIARNEHLRAMRENGVQVLSPRGDFVAYPNATDDPAEIGPVDYVFLGLKAHSYPSCGPLVEPLLGEHTAVLPAQNGIPWWYFHELPGPYQGRRIEAVDPGGATSAVLSPERAIGCVVYPATTIEAPGVIRHLEGTRFSIGEPSGEISQRCKDVERRDDCRRVEGPGRGRPAQRHLDQADGQRRVQPASARSPERRWSRSVRTRTPARSSFS